MFEEGEVEALLEICNWSHCVYSIYIAVKSAVLRRIELENRVPNVSG